MVEALRARSKLAGVAGTGNGGTLRARGHSSPGTNEKPRSRRGSSRSDREPRSARDHVDRLARLGALDLELDRAVDEREQGVVAAEADARTRMEARTALA